MGSYPEQSTVRFAAVGLQSRNGEEGTAETGLVGTDHGHRTGEPSVNCGERSKKQTFGKQINNHKVCIAKSLSTVKMH